MKYTRSENEHEITLSPREQATASVILLHGLGADGWDLLPLAQALDLPDSMPVRFVLPHAPVRAVTVSGGYEMRAWFDVRDITPEDRADPQGLKEATLRVTGYLRSEQGQGVPASRVVLAGFSQGGALALHAGLRHAERLAGIVALSTFLPFPDALEDEQSAANAQAPILMCHGAEDSIVPVAVGRQAGGFLEGMGHPLEWHEYPMDHEICAEEVAVVSRWLRARLPARL